jgi:hypothetical protein
MRDARQPTAKANNEGHSRHPQYPWHVAYKRRRKGKGHKNANLKKYEALRFMTPRSRRENLGFGGWGASQYHL